MPVQAICRTHSANTFCCWRSCTQWFAASTLCNNLPCRAGQFLYAMYLLRRGAPGRMVHSVTTGVTSAMRRLTRRETTVLISVTRRVYLYGQRISFHWLLWAHLIGTGRIPRVGTPSVSGKEPGTRFREHPVFTKRHHVNQRKSKPSEL